jgi:hypothetical protein
MKRIILILLCLSVLTDLQSQSFKGKVVDQATDSAIYNAAIFFNGTSNGTLSDRNGFFEIDISGYRNMPLTINALGYYSVSITDFTSDKVIFLSPKLHELNEVVISEKKAKRNLSARKRNLEIFRTQFLGSTFNARNCEILNESDIYLSFNGPGIKAFAYKPLQIRNKSLGYSIIYFLDRFEYNGRTGSLTLLGNIIFKDEISSLEEDQRSKIERRRVDTYLGSRMHFFRSLWENTLKENDFQLSIITKEKIMDFSGNKPDDYPLVYESDSIMDGIRMKFLNHEGNLNIYYGFSFASSTMIIIKKYVYYDKAGYFDPLGVSWSGEMSKKRIGDLLPYEYEMYSPDNQSLPVEPEAAEPPSSVRTEKSF